MRILKNGDLQITKKEYADLILFNLAHCEATLTLLETETDEEIDMGDYFIMTALLVHYMALIGSNNRRIPNKATATVKSLFKDANDSLISLVKTLQKHNNGERLIAHFEQFGCFGTLHKKAIETIFENLCAIDITLKLKTFDRIINPCQN